MNSLTTTRDRRKAARAHTAPLLVSARPRLETYAVRRISLRARVSPAHAVLIAELIGIGREGV
jgi:hypothetical protein